MNGQAFRGMFAANWPQGPYYTIQLNSSSKFRLINVKDVEGRDELSHELQSEVTQRL